MNPPRDLHEGLRKLACLIKAAIKLVRGKPDLIAFWEDRAKKHGRRSVLNTSHSEEEYDQVTEMQKREIFPHLVSALNGTEKVVLDFGCGPGRFTASLASLIQGKAIGVDPIQTLLDSAPKAGNVEYRRTNGKKIPLRDGSIDVVWVCLVLGGIRDLQATVKELKRVLKPGGLLCVIENTAECENREHWFFRSVKEYQEAFQLPLQHFHDYHDAEERISVMIGRI